MRFFGAKDKLYKKIEEKQSRTTNEKQLIFEALEQKNYDLYKIYYLLNTKNSLWDKNSKGENLFSIINKNNIYFKNDNKDCAEQMLTELD